MKRKMFRIFALLGVSVVMCAGCQTRITAEKFAEVAHPIQAVVQTNGVDVVITTGYMVTSGGWYATARSPLYAKEELRGLNIGVSTNGTVSMLCRRCWMAWFTVMRISQASKLPVAR